jgi:LysM repeat protein
MASMAVDLHKRIGPLPAYAWGGLVGLVVVGYMYYKSSHAASTAATPTTDPTAGTSDSIDGAFTPGTTSGSGGASDVTDPGTSDTSALPTNQTWLSQGVQFLSGIGVSALNAQRNLSDYLSGVTLTANQAASIEPYLKAQGLPPEGAPTPHVLAAPKTSGPKSTVAPVGHVTVTPAPTKAAKAPTLTYHVQSGDTLGRVATKYHTTVSALTKANHIANPNEIKAGQILRIP